MRSPSTVATFFAVVVLSALAMIIVWPDNPGRYLPGDFWPSGAGLRIGSFERETMRLGLDLQGGSHLVLQAEPPDDYTGDIGEALEVAADVIERRVNAFGVSEAEISIASGNRIDVQVPGLSLAEAENLIGRTAQLEYRVINANGQEVPATGVVNGVVVAMTGEYLESNTFAQLIGVTYAVSFETTGDGAELMRQITSAALQFPTGSQQNLLLVYLDGLLISRASVTGVISDRGQITGQSTFSEANDLARQLNAGALPIPLRVIQSNEVSASLGADSVKKSVNAAEIGLVAVMIFMVLYYRLPGLVASVALIMYTAITLAVFKIWPVTLSLSGIAAFILSIGMAIDANILIFERMKEELRRGRTLNTAIDVGFRRAWPSIRDSNIATFISCAILFWFGDQFGAAFVKGFALTLAIGVGISMFSAITITRTLLKMLVGTPVAGVHWLFNAKEGGSGDDAGGAKDKQPWFFDFSRIRWYTLGFSAVLVTSAVVIFSIQPSLKAGIEFTGGSTFTIQFTEETVEQSELREFLGDIGHDEARVQGAGTNTFLIRTSELDGAPALGGEPGPVPPGEIDTIMGQLADEFGAVERLDFSTVSGTVSKEIARSATLAVAVAAIAIMLYIWFAFRHVSKPLRYGVCAVIALVHDAVIVLGIFSLMAKINGTEVDAAFVVAILTIIGFSVHDTIVVFDRIREHISRDPYIPFGEAVNVSLTETLARSLNTSFVTVLTIVAMFLIGGVTIQNFLLVLLIGVIAGTYSSIGVAAQVLVAWDEGDVRRFFSRSKRSRDEEVEPAAEPATETTDS